jgi:hypothetical protein
MVATNWTGLVYPSGNRWEMDLAQQFLWDMVTQLAPKYNDDADDWRQIKFWMRSAKAQSETIFSVSC